MRNNLVRIFFDVDFRCGHEGLKKMMMKKGLNTADLEEDDMVVFVNSAKNKLKALKMLPEANSFGVLGYYRSPRGRIDLRAIMYIPQAFGATGAINMDAATQKLLERELPAIAKRGETT